MESKKVPGFWFSQRDAFGTGWLMHLRTQNQRLFYIFDK